MAIEKKSDCVILGLLSHEDLTGYEIKKRMAQKIIEIKLSIPLQKTVETI